MARQYNLRHDTQYSILSSWYAELESGNTCDNCGKNISNCVEIENLDKKRFVVGMDCASTLSGIKDSLVLSFTEASFQQAKSARAKLLKFRKDYPLGTIRIETLPEGKGYYKESDSGVISCDFRPEQGQPYYTMKQYPADVWMPYVLPMVKNIGG